MAGTVKRGFVVHSSGGITITIINTVIVTSKSESQQKRVNTEKEKEEKKN